MGSEESKRSSGTDDADLLREMVSTPSPTGETDGIRDLLIDAAGWMGLEASVDGAGNVRMTTGTDGGRHVLFLCHMDTVPGDIEVRMADGFLHGRGSVDAKGCLASALVAASAFAGTDRGRVTVVAVPDEEGPSMGVRELVSGPAPDFVVVGEPSGWEGITIGYKGVVRLRYASRTDKVHAGMESSSSAEDAIAFWQSMKAYCQGQNAEGSPTGAFGSISPTLVSINTFDDGLELRTEMVLDIRFPPGFDAQRLHEHLRSSRGGAEVEMTEETPPVLVPKNNELVRALLASIRGQGGEPRFKKKTGTSDMNVAAAVWEGVPIVAYGPGDSRLDHTPEERLDLAEYGRAIAVLRATIDRLLG